MIVSKSSEDKHKHDYSTLDIRRVSADNKLYSGTTGDKAIIYQKCQCGASKAIDYGDVRKMAVKFKTFSTNKD